MLHIDAHWIRAQFDNGNGNRQGLADAMGLRRDIISKILTGKRQIKADELRPIAEYFGVGISTPGADGAAIPSGSSGFDAPALQDHGDSWRRLMDRLALLTDEELDYLSVAAEGLHARRSQRGEIE